MLPHHHLAQTQVDVKRQLMVDKQLLSKPRKLEKFLLKNPLPAVKGPLRALFIVDHHHLSRALVQLGIEHVRSSTCVFFEYRVLLGVIMTTPWTSDIII